MKTQPRSIGLVLISCIASVQPLIASYADHLLPVEPERNPKYWKILMSKIGVAPFNCGRAIILPAFEPEGATSVYGLSKNGRTSYYVTDVSARKNVWQQTDGARFPEKGQLVGVERRDAEISAHTALLVREVWMRMLSGPQTPKPTPPQREVVTLDATTVEFSLELPNRPPLRGELVLSEPYRGKKTEQLVDLWNRLFEYCKAAPHKRSAIADDIERRATQLLSLLQH
jgi:hypothetical protein